MIITGMLFFWREYSSTISANTLVSSSIYLYNIYIIFRGSFIIENVYSYLRPRYWLLIKSQLADCYLFIYFVKPPHAQYIH